MSGLKAGLWGIKRDIEGLPWEAFFVKNAT